MADCHGPWTLTSEGWRPRPDLPYGGPRTARIFYGWNRSVEDALKFGLGCVEWSFGGRESRSWLNAAKDETSGPVSGLCEQ